MSIFCPHLGETDLSLIVTVYVFIRLELKQLCFTKPNFSHSIVYSVFLPHKQSSALIPQVVAL